MRGREFVMKDAYSFDKSIEDAKASYQIMAQTYRRIFDRFGLQYRAVSADSGAIGGDLSEEFQVIAATGEDAIVFCPSSDYAANMEKAQSLAPQGPRAQGVEVLEKVLTPGTQTCEEVSAFLKKPLRGTVKSLVWVLEPEPESEHDVRHAVAPSSTKALKHQLILILLRGDHELNEVKLGKVPGMNGTLRLAHSEEIQAAFGCVPGFLGPVGLDLEEKGVRLLVDREVALMSDWVCGANEKDHHLTGVNWARDLPEPTEAHIFDLRCVVAGDLSPDGKGALSIERGIEVGHIFYLGTKYSKAMNATFLDENGKPQAMEMGCYGIGVTRLPAAAIEQNHDERGIIWPDAIAPFVLVICPIGADRSQAVKDKAQEIYDQALAKGWDVILDDRGERPGVMFADWELIGVPHRLVIGDRGLKEGMLEYQHRRDASATQIGVNEVMAHLERVLGN
jgi:prolyl-tRNA synthetase